MGVTTVTAFHWGKDLGWWTYMVSKDMDLAGLGSITL